MRILATLALYSHAHGLGIGLSIQKWAAVRVGWGWDEDLPLRPWPGVHLGYTPSNHNRDLCFAWFGFYVGLSWRISGGSDENA